MSEGRLLIVSEDAAISELLQTTFTEQGYDVVCVKGLDVAVENIGIEPLDTLLFDTELAFSELKSIVLKARAMFPFVPIIWIILRDDFSPRMGLGDSLFESDDIVSKPFDIEELKFRVKSAVKAKRRFLEQQRQWIKWHIFLISTDSLLVENLHTYFDQLDFELIEASEVKQVIPDLLTRWRVDVFILDFSLSDEALRELCWKIRNSTASVGIPIIFLAEKESVLEKIGEFVVNDDSYLPKPFTPQTLEQVVEKYSRSIYR